jgi:hypothetical protein
MAIAATTTERLEHDEVNLRDDDRSRSSMREFCVFDFEVVIAHKLEHETLDRLSLERALEALERRPRSDPARLAQCNARLQDEIAARLSAVEAAIARGDRDGARRCSKTSTRVTRASPRRLCSSWRRGAAPSNEVGGSALRSSDQPLPPRRDAGDDQ